MFEPSDKPRVFGIPPGADFPSAVVTGLDLLTHKLPPHEAARAEIYLNSNRMRRRVRLAFSSGPPRLIPALRLVTEVTEIDAALSDAEYVTPLHRKLIIAQLIRKLLDADTSLAPQTSLFDLADSLVALLDEMEGEGVSAEVFAQLDVSDQSGQWQRALQFLDILGQFLAANGADGERGSGPRSAVLRKVARWTTDPPQHPVIVAGSTGSRGATSLLMQAVARLPQGALILPGFDFAMPAAVWATLDDRAVAEDHPQFRYAKLLRELGITAADVRHWPGETSTPVERNRFVSLALRPAPVTNQWLDEGTSFAALDAIMRPVTLVVTDSQRAEAETIALRLRQAVNDGVTAALITPDRALTRQVTALLSRWDIVPDDSAGKPLALSPPGRFLRQVLALHDREIAAAPLLALLKHPLCHSGEDRARHLLLTRELELYLRKTAPAFVTAQVVDGWVSHASPRHVGVQAWAEWLKGLICVETAALHQTMGAHLLRHRQLAERWAAGSLSDGSGQLWNEAAGREALTAFQMLDKSAEIAGELSKSEYQSLFSNHLASGIVREPSSGHPGVLIWGTIEARVQGAQLVILGGLNEGVWPEMPSPDPWLNRALRAQAGLLLPERQIGLSAHDFQQAIGAAEVWLTRSRRSAEAQTVPSRWLNRLTTLLSGLPDQGGALALREMTERGEHWATMAQRSFAPSEPTPRATRPSPSPPVAARPRKLSVTRVKTLVRDPYAIYAEYVLRLRPMDPITVTADAPLRGIILHKVLELFIESGVDPRAPDSSDRLIAIARDVLDEMCPWPTVRLLWLSRFSRIAGRFTADETDRRMLASPAVLEKLGTATLTSPPFTLTCKADRIDLTEAGDAVLYDYKTGTVPTKPQQEHFDKQLLLAAAMVERGAFEEVGPRPVHAAWFIGVNPAMKSVPAPLETSPAAVVWQEFQKLVAAWDSPSRGYTSRLALFSKDDRGAYDHLARYGEWDLTDTPVRDMLT